MSDPSADFGTGLRAHLGLEQNELDATAEPAPEHEPEDEPLPDAALAEHEPESESAMLETLIAFESELLERERALAHREANFAGRAGALLAAAKELYDEVLAGNVINANHDELARMRRRKSGAA
jgi:hypothetical protein